jgi:hypothetical protein
MCPIESPDGRVGRLPEHTTALRRGLPATRKDEPRRVRSAEGFRRTPYRVRSSSTIPRHHWTGPLSCRPSLRSAGRGLASGSGQHGQHIHRCKKSKPRDNLWCTFHQPRSSRLGGNSSRVRKKVRLLVRNVPGDGKKCGVSWVNALGSCLRRKKRLQGHSDQAFVLTGRGLSPATRL